MKNSLSFLAILLSALLLTSCGTRSDKKPAKLSELELLKKNTQNWNHQTKGAQMVHLSGTYNDFNGSVHSLKAIENMHSDSSVIKGKVLNLHQVKYNHSEEGSIFPAYTRMEIKVNTIIGGNKKPAKKVIDVLFADGLTTYNSFYKRINPNLKRSRKVFVQDDNVPLPRIGSEVIMSIQESDWAYACTYLNAIKNGFHEDRFYQPVMQTLHFWIKNPGDKEFIANNTVIKNKEPRAEKIAPETQLTADLNAKYN